MSSSTPEAAAIALFQAGRLAEAEAAWRAILAERPGDSQALHLLGVILARTGRREEGLELLERSIGEAPRNAGFLNNRALVLAELGRHEEALRDLRRAVQLDPTFYAGYCHLGSMLRQLGRLDEAMAGFRRAIAIDARFPDAHVGLGNVLLDRGDRPGARAEYEIALRTDPGHGSAHYNRGNLLLEEGDLAGAEAAFRQALAREPRHAMALNNLGVALRRTGRIEEACACFERSLGIAPANAEALNNLGLALQQRGELDRAQARYEAAVAARPRFAAAITNWGNVLKDRGDLEGAAALYDRALEAQPDYVEALNNRGNVALEAGDTEGAKRRYARAAQLRSDFVDPRFSLGQIALREHDFAAGWEAFELRFRTTPPMATARTFGKPRLAREDLGRARRVAIWREQGVGDQILFSTLLPELAARGVGAVVEMDARLVAPYRRGLPGFEFVPPEEAEAAFAACDFELPLGSLARLLRPDVASFAAQPRALLTADPARVERIRASLGTGRFVAVSWHSFQKRDRRYIERRKSIPLECFARLAEGCGVRLLDLQYGDVESERAAFVLRHPGALVRIEGLDTFNDFEGLLAAIACCERVVTASNVTAHLAGALGKPTSLLYLQAQAPFHYWAPGADRRSLWYPSVEIVTDPSWTAWEPAIEAIAERLTSPASP